MATPENHLEPLDVLIRAGVALPPLPDVGRRLMLLAGQPVEHIEAKKLADFIEKDEDLRNRLLRVANSPYFVRNTPITNLRQAILLISLEESLNTLNYFVVSRSLPRFQALEGFYHADFWAHSWACAAAAQYLANIWRPPKIAPGEVFLAGLLHGIGKAALALARWGEYSRCLHLAKRRQIPMFSAEERVLGYHHGQLGARLLEKWQVPAPVRSAIRCYVAPETALPEAPEAAALIQLANVLANLSEIGSDGAQESRDIDDTYIVREGVQPLAGEIQRPGHVERIVETLQKKATMIFGFGFMKQPVNADGRRHDAVATHPLNEPNTATDAARQAAIEFWIKRARPVE